MAYHLCYPALVWNTRESSIGHLFAIRAPQGAFVDCACTLVFQTNTEGLQALFAPDGG